MARVTTTPYALTHKDGAVTILRAVDAHGIRGVEQFVAAYAKGDNPVLDVVKIDPAIVPRDTAYRNAWSFDGQSFGHDIAKARELHRDKLRTARKTLIEREDIKVSAALATGNAEAAKAAETERQRLRDVPADPRIAAAKTMDELRAVWPL